MDKLSIKFFPRRFGDPAVGFRAMPGEPEPDSGGDASITTGHVIIAAMLGAFATGILAIAWFVVNAVIETVQGARRMLR
jgi:hypothetical protein